MPFGTYFVYCECLLLTVMSDWLSPLRPGLLEDVFVKSFRRTQYARSSNTKHRCEDSVSLYFYFRNPLTNVDISLVLMTKGSIFYPLQ